MTLRRVEPVQQRQVAEQHPQQQQPYQQQTFQPQQFNQPPSPYAPAYSQQQYPAYYQPQPGVAPQYNQQPMQYPQQQVIFVATPSTGWKKSAGAGIGALVGLTLGDFFGWLIGSSDSYTTAGMCSLIGFIGGLLGGAFTGYYIGKMWHEDDLRKAGILSSEKWNIEQQMALGYLQQQPQKQDQSRKSGKV